MKISIKIIVYAKFIINFFKHSFSKKSQWTAVQFTELIKPFFAIITNVTNMKKRSIIALQKIAEN